MPLCISNLKRGPPFSPPGLTYLRSIYGRSERARGEKEGNFELLEVEI